MKLAGEAQAELIKYAVIGLAVIGLAWYVKNKVSDTADDALSYVADLADNFNPFSDENIVYDAGNAIVRKYSKTASKDETVGTWWWGLWNDDPFANDPTIIGSEAYKKQQQQRTGASGTW